MKKVFLLFLLLSIPICATTLIPQIVQEKYGNQPIWISYDFDLAMQTIRYPRSVAITKQVVGIDGNEFLSFCRELYNKNNPDILPVLSTPIIPKIIHQIWIGGQVPEAFKKYMESWVAHHLGPEWEYKLWTDKEVETLELYNRVFYDESDNPGVKSDILKWELVWRFGGVYVDTDFECFKPLDFFHHTYDFYTALQPLDTQYAQLGAALFGARPGHPILEHTVKTIKDDWHRKGAPAKTGPIHFTKSFFAVAGKDGLKDIAFPAFYFYPLGCQEHEITRGKWTAQGAFAVHHWAKSWMPAKYRLAEFKNLDNDQSTQNWNE